MSGHVWGLASRSDPVRPLSHQDVQLLENVVLRGKDIGDPDRPWADKDLVAAKERLRVTAALGERELRDLSSTGNPFIPVGAAVYVANEFAVAARAERRCSVRCDSCRCRATA